MLKKHPTLDDYDCLYKFHPGTDASNNRNKLQYTILDDKNLPLLNDYR